MPDYLSDAPQWAIVVYWAAAAIFGGIFMAAVPRLRAGLARVTPAPEPRPDMTMRLVGAAISHGLDGVKIAHEAERIADAMEGIERGIKSLAESEERETHRMMEDMADKLSRLDQKIDRR